jgi:hypothetical protein
MRQRVELRIVGADREGVVGAILDAHQRVADDDLALDRQDQEAAPGPEALDVQRATTLPRQLVVLDQRQRADRRAVVMMQGQPQFSEVVNPLDAGELSSHHAGLSVNPRLR